MRKLVVPTAGRGAEAHAAAHRAPWAAADATFFGKDSEHYMLQELDWEAVAKVAAAKL